MRRLTSLAVGAVALVFPGACAEGSGTDGVAVDGPVMRYPVRSDETVAMAALLEGTLALKGGCLYLVQEGTGLSYPVLWPAGTRWDDEHDWIISPGGVQLATGDQVSGGGGFQSVSQVQRLAGAEAAAVAGRCVNNQYGEIAVFNNRADSFKVRR